MNDERTIITDRMGPWNEQDVVLTWEGDSDAGNVSLTPDEVEILFEKNLIKNVVRGENGLYQKSVYADIRTYNGAIVCGIMAPSTRAGLRQEILDYARKMEYVTEAMTPVKMFTGTKSLILNEDGTYSIFFSWYDKVAVDFNQELDEFTRNFFRNQAVEIVSNGILMYNLTENEVFSRENIDIWRDYDIQLYYLRPRIDKCLLLRALIQRAFIDDFPCNTLRRGQFEKVGNIAIPEHRQERITFNEFGKKKMNCGTAYYSNEYGNETYTYQIDVPYSEYIRELMVNTEKVLQVKYGKNVYVRFSGFNQNIFINFKGKEIVADVERELIALDYAMTFLHDESQCNKWQLYGSIISMLETDSSGKYRNEYFSYLEMLKHVFPDKCKGM